jgi:hypothetical protein
MGLESSGPEVPQLATRHDSEPVRLCNTFWGFIQLTSCLSLILLRNIVVVCGRHCRWATERNVTTESRSALCSRSSEWINAVPLVWPRRK